MRLSAHDRASGRRHRRAFLLRFAGALAAVLVVGPSVADVLPFGSREHALPTTAPDRDLPIRIAPIPFAAGKSSPGKDPSRVGVQQIEGTTQMTPRELTIAIDKILHEESRYATGLEEGGDFGRAKLAWAAIEEIRRAQRQAATADEASFATALRDALYESRAEYNEYWDDPSGVGSSTFARVLDLV